MSLGNTSSCEDLCNLSAQDRKIRDAWRSCAIKARRDGRQGLSINTQMAASARSLELLEEQTPTQFDMSPQPPLSPQSAPMSSSRRGSFGEGSLRSSSSGRGGRRHVSDEPMATLASQREAHAAVVDMRREAMTAALEGMARDRGGSFGRPPGDDDDDDYDDAASSEFDVRAVLGAPLAAEGSGVVDVERPFYSPKGVEEGEATTGPPEPGLTRTSLSAHDAEKMLDDFSKRVQARSADLCSTSAPAFGRSHRSGRFGEPPRPAASWWNCCAAAPGER